MAKKFRIGDFLKDNADSIKEQAVSVTQAASDLVGNVLDETKKGYDVLTSWEGEYKSIKDELNKAIRNNNKESFLSIRRRANKLLDSSNLLGATFHNKKGRALLLLSSCAKSDAEKRKFLIRAMGVNDKDIKDEATDQYKAVTKDIISNFIESYKPIERQCLFFVKNIDELIKCYGENEDEQMWVFTKIEYPTSVVFPSKFPEAYELYISHPVFDDHYIKFADAEDYLFSERFMVISRILKGLGAKRIEMTFDREEYIGKASSLLSKIGITLKDGTEAYSGSHSRKQTRESDKEAKETRIIVAECTPTIIEVPEDLKIWCQLDKEISNLVKSRMDTNETNTCQIEISSKSLLNLNSFESDKVKASYSNMMTSIDGNFKIDKEKAFIQKNKKTIAMNVMYATKNEIAENKKKSNSWYKFWQLLKK